MKPEELLDRLKRETEDDHEHCVMRYFLEYVGIDGIKLEGTGLDDIWFSIDGYKIKCEIEEEKWMARLTIENCITITAKDKEEQIRIYRTINNFSFSYDAKLYYDLKDDDTFIISAMIMFPVEPTSYPKGHIYHHALRLILLPNNFDSYLHEHYDVVESGDICNKTFDKQLPELIPHRDEIMNVLEDMGCSPEISEDEADYIYFTFQEEEFGLWINTRTEANIVFYNNGWYSCEMADIDKLSEIRRMVNELNSASYWNLSYRRDMDEKKYYVFSCAGLTCLSAETIIWKMPVVLNEFFEVRNRFIRKLTLFDYIKEKDGE